MRNIEEPSECSALGIRGVRRDKWRDAGLAKSLPSFYVIPGMNGAASNTNLLSRAYAAYFRSGAVDLPSNGSDAFVFGGKTYVVLRNVHGILAIYRLLKSGQLRRLRCYPAELDRAVRALA
jgi:hypothetical protein